MLIVLEGCDGSGKSRLANLLRQTLNAEVIHATRETPNNFGWFTLIMDEAKNRNIIMDRAFWGQFVYQEPEDRKLTEDDREALERRLYKDGGKLIYVYASEPAITRRLSHRNEKPSLPVERILKQYKKLCERAKCPVIWYNTQTGFSKPFEIYRKERNNDQLLSR